MAIVVVKKSRKYKNGPTKVELIFVFAEAVRPRVRFSNLTDSVHLFLFCRIKDSQNMEKLFESHTRAKQFALSPPKKKNPFGFSFLCGLLEIQTLYLKPCKDILASFQNDF